MENKLIMSQKEECDNYNLITETIDKLVDMCDNAEAIVLRDDLFELFITKYSEPLYNVLGLQEDLGCPLDVIFKALRDGVYYEYSKWAFGKVKFQKLKVCLKYEYKGYVLAPIHKADFSICLEGYKHTWFLKEDKSE